MVAVNAAHNWRANFAQLTDQMLFVRRKSETDAHLRFSARRRNQLVPVSLDAELTLQGTKSRKL
jgi:hypothetical protein